MPKLFRRGSLILYVWTDEGDPLEPVHVHIADNVQSAHADKFWLSKNGYFVPARGNNKVKVREAAMILNSFIEIDGIQQVKDVWMRQFGSIHYFDE